MTPDRSPEQSPREGRAVSGAGRRDARRNRDQLLAAAREVFAREGTQAPLEHIAKRAGVSRTTLHRHFSSRRELIESLLEENVRLIEAAADGLHDDVGVVRLFDIVLDLQAVSPSLIRHLYLEASPASAELGARTAAAFAPLVARGQAAGVLHPGAGLDEVMVALHMASAAVTTVASGGPGNRADAGRAVLRRGLFAQPD